MVKSDSSSNSETKVVVVSEINRPMIDSSPNIQSAASSVASSQVITVNTLSNRVLVASPNLFTERVATARTVIQDESTVETKRTIVPNTPTITTFTLSPAPVFTANIKASSKGKKFSLDPSINDPVLPVRCRNTRGDLYKSKFGSGNRGKCILVAGKWCTPSEFEAFCGRGNSKDWKRSIRYGGRALQCLIEEGVLTPHATSCSCTNCCESTSGEEAVLLPMSGPVRLFTPYKRRKKQKTQNSGESASLASENCISVSEVPSTASIQVLTASSTLLDPPLESIIISPDVTAPQAPKFMPTTLDFNEQKNWWQLEELAKNIVRQAQELQNLVGTAKVQSAAYREAALQQLRNQMENEKKEALNASRVEAQMNLSRAILEAKTEKESAIAEAVQKVEAEMKEKLKALTSEKSSSVKQCANCNREAYSECTGCHKVSYCSTFCQRKDWQNHQDDCGEHTSVSGEFIEEITEEVEQP